MAWLSMPSGKTDLARRTSTAGQRNIALEASSNPEYKIQPDGCIQCSHRDFHGVCQWVGTDIPFGQDRNFFLFDSEKISIDEVNTIQQGIFLAHMGLHGLPLNIIFNAGSGGTGNNATQAFDYDIISTSGSTLGLRGPNPRRVSINNRRTNPEFIPGGGGQDPVTGEDSRLVNDISDYSVPSGGLVEFLYPSALAGKLFPVIKKINMPGDTQLEDVEFSVVTTADVGAAREPFDLAFPSNKYRCRIHWEAIYPMNFANLQEYDETQFTIRKRTVTAPGVVTLKNTAGEDCRILYPDMKTINPVDMPDGPFICELVLDSVSTILTEQQCLDRIQTLQTGNKQWVTTFDLSNDSFDVARITYCPEARSADRYRAPHTGQCINCQRDHSDSYKHAGDRHCCNIDNADLFDDFQETCWQPECGGFGLQCGDQIYGSVGKKPDSVYDPDLWTRLYFSSNWLIQQSVAGASTTRNFNLIKPSKAVPSISTFAGVFRPNVSIELEAYTEDFQVGTAGELVTWTDSNGDDWIRVLSGGFFQEGEDFTALDGPNRLQDITQPTGGILAFSAGRQNRIDYHPVKEDDITYLGKRNVGSSFGVSSHNQNYAPAEWSQTEAFLIAWKPEIVTELNTEIQDLFNGIAD